MTENEYYANLAQAKAIQHHGIGGMKWGKRNGPPYPLSGSNKLKSDKARMKTLQKEYKSIEKSSGGSSGPTKHQSERMSEIKNEMNTIKSNGYNEAKQKQKDTAKKVAIGATAVATVSVGVALAVKNPATTMKLVKSMKNTTVKALKGAPSKTVNLGKRAAKSALTGFKEGVKEGVKEGPKRAGKTAAVGLAMLGMKELMDMTVGKETAAKVYKANNNKKIDSFWKVGLDDREYKNRD